MVWLLRPLTSNVLTLCMQPVGHMMVCVCLCVCVRTFLTLSKNDTNRKMRRSLLFSVSPFRFPFLLQASLAGERSEEQPLYHDSPALLPPSSLLLLTMWFYVLVTVGEKYFIVPLSCDPDLCVCVHLFCLYVLKMCFLKLHKHNQIKSSTDYFILKTCFTAVTIFDGGRKIKCSVFCLHRE